MTPPFPFKAPAPPLAPYRRVCGFCGRWIAVRGGRLVYHHSKLGTPCEGTSNEPARTDREALLRAGKVARMSIEQLVACIDERLIDGSMQESCPAGFHRSQDALDELARRAAR